MAYLIYGIPAVARLEAQPVMNELNQELTPRIAGIR
jgi:hypothetical protein